MKINNSKLKEYFANDKGSALLTVLILLLLFALIGSSVLLTSMNNLNIAIKMSEYEDSYYIAESGAQHALSFVKEEITEYYMYLYEIPPTNPWEYDIALAAFYPTIIERVCTDASYADTCEYVPLDYSSEGVDITVNISVDPNTPIPTFDYGLEGNTVRFLIECVAESDDSRRVVNAVVEIDDPDIDWDMTSAPPMTDMRMLIGDEIVLTDDLNAGEYNAVFCRGSALIANAFVPQFLENHMEFLNTYTYEFSNAVPTILKWDLQYSKFPVHDAFNTFDSLFDASKNGTATYDSFFDWRNRTIDYNISNYAPNTYSNDQIVDSTSTNLTYSFRRDPQDSVLNYKGTASNPIRVYAKRGLTITGTGNMEYCYIFAEQNVTININGSIKNSIIISNTQNVYINCYSIVNDSHMLIKAYYVVDIELNTGYYGGAMTNVVVRSTNHEIRIDHDGSVGNTKTPITSCYFHTNKSDKDAQIYLRDLYLVESFVNAGKDLILRNCSAKYSSFYAFGYTDNDVSYYGTSYLFTQDNYVDHMEYYPSRNPYFERLYRGIIIISELSQKAGDIYQKETLFTNCDFTTNETIFLCDPNSDYHDMYYSSRHEDYDTYMAELRNCRLLADREVLLEDIVFDRCYTYAGIRGYENEQDYIYNPYYGYEKLHVVRGIYMRMDDLHNEIKNSVFYSRGRMMYSQNTPESYGYPVTEHGKVRVYSSFFYSIKNFEYNGKSTSEGLDTTIMRNDSSLCNNMIIMTEANMGPHEYSPSVADDVLFIGGDLQLDPNKPHYSGTLYDLIGGEAMRGIDGSIEVQCDKLYDNYFEQLLELDEIQRVVPGFTDVFIYEDIYEKKEAGNGG